MADLATRLRYLAWAVRHIPRADRQCPWCGGDSQSVRRRALGTQLCQCCECHLRFLVPKQDIVKSQTFYNNEYRQGFTTDCPNDDALERLLQTGFAGSEKDYARYCEVMQAFGVRPGSTILDFGCSWEYGSWQLREPVIACCPTT